jgi:hypothetical protein
VSVGVIEDFCEASAAWGEKVTAQAADWLRQLRGDSRDRGAHASGPPPEVIYVVAADVVEFCVLPWVAVLAENPFSPEWRYWARDFELNELTFPLCEMVADYCDEVGAHRGNDGERLSAGFTGAAATPFGLTERNVMRDALATLQRDGWLDERGDDIWLLTTPPHHQV